MNDLKSKYLKLIPDYDRLSENLVGALELFVKDNEIEIFKTESRVKTCDSFLEKITRKSYKKPFDDIEDICGIRIICYYQEDLAKIQKIINEEFEIISQTDKIKELSDNQFGYNSHHYIIKLKNDWLKAPNYRGLKALKAEIQVRTMLMHSWAAISHKLSYKISKDVPPEFLRKLNRLSALVELADEQFDQIKNLKLQYKSDVLLNGTEINSSVELSSDSLNALLNYYFPKRDYIEEDTPSLLADMRKFDISLTSLDQRIKACLSILDNMEAEELPDSRLPLWSTTGAARTVLDLTSDKYYNSRKDFLSKNNCRTKYRALIEFIE